MGIFQRGNFLVDGKFPKGQIFGRWEFFQRGKFLVDGNFPKGQFLVDWNFPKGQIFGRWEFSERANFTRMLLPFLMTVCSFMQLLRM